MHHISFEVTHVPDVDEEDNPCRRGWVSAVINGRRLGTSGVPVDFFQLLSHRGISGDRFTFLTCSCGVAGCAGFHMESHQLWGSDVVRWHLFAEEYKNYLPFARTAPGRPDFLELVFETRQLEQALDALRVRLDEVLAQGPCLLAPGDFDPVRDSRDLDESLRRQREWELNQQADDARNRATFGVLYTQKIVARVDYELALEAPAWRVLKACLDLEADALGMSDRDTADAWVREQVAAKNWVDRLQREPQSICDLLAKVVWNDIWYLWSPLQGKRPTDSPDWSSVGFSLVEPAVLPQ